MGGVAWGDPDAIGKRVVTVQQFPLATTDRCADPETLSRLREAYARRERKGRRIEPHEFQKENARRSNPFH
jgi:hypothetical protein